MNFKRRRDVLWSYINIDNVYLRCCATSHYKAMALLLVGSYFKEKEKDEERFRRCNSENLDVKMYIKSRNWDKENNIVLSRIVWADFRNFTNFILELKKKWKPVNINKKENYSRQACRQISQTHITVPKSIMQ